MKNNTNNYTAEQKKNNQKVMVVTDSVAQVSLEIAKDFNITVVPLTVTIEGESFQDGIDLNLKDLYQRMREEKIVPTTTTPSPGEFFKVFQKIVHRGYQEILFISLSKKLSSCYDTACLAAEQIRQLYPQVKIKVLDSRTAGIAQGFVVYAASRAALEGKSLPEVIAAAEEAIPRTGMVAELGTLEYLARGGRIGKAAYLLGRMIDIKPILTLDNKGIVSPLKQVRTEARALQEMVIHVAKKVQGCKNYYLAILEADAPEQAAKLTELVNQKLKPTKLFKAVFTPVMGVHTGPDLVGLGYYYE